MGTVVEVTSVRDPDREGRYNLAEKSKVALKTEIERLLLIINKIIQIN